MKEKSTLQVSKEERNEGEMDSWGLRELRNEGEIDLRRSLRKDLSD